MHIYFAAPFFCPAERDFNLKLTTKIEMLGFSVFLPQRDGVELKEELFRELSEVEICRKIFNIDRIELLKADVFLMILDGRFPDEGVCVELGIAHENKYIDNKEKLLIGFITEMRVFSEKFKLNAMLLGALDDLVNNEIDLIEKINAYSKENPQ